MIKKVLHHLNPVSHLGEKRYSILFPLTVTTIMSALSEIYAYFIVKNPDAVGVYAIFIFVAAIIYFAFRSGIPGGFTASGVTIAYYAYIITTRNAPPAQKLVQWETTLVLAILYFVLSGLIGWLKQTIDTLIEREANEKRRLQTIIEQLPVGVLITDNKGTLEQGNKQIEVILGRKIGERIAMSTESLIESEWPIAESLRTGKSIVGKEYTVEKENGKKMHLQISSSVIQNIDGNVIAAASIINDITQQKEIEARKDDFVNMASHELKTPITSMKLYIDSLYKIVDSNNNERAVKLVSSIKYQTERLQDLINNLLDVSRLQTGKLTLKKEDLQLEQLIKETIDELQGWSKDHTIVFESGGPTVIHADKFRLYQVFANLLTNAIKYSPVNSYIYVKLKKENNKVIISVEDSGIGIDKDQQEKIFDRLYQVTDPKEKTFPGMGMGLYISKEIIKYHHGTMWVVSEKDKGATFYFSLPL